MSYLIGLVIVLYCAACWSIAVEAMSETIISEEIKWVAIVFAPIAMPMALVFNYFKGWN